MTSSVDPIEQVDRPGLGSAASAGDVLSKPVLLAMFLFCMTQPYDLEVGPLLIGPYRLILIIMGPILTVQWMLGRFGRLQLPDFLIMGYATWMLVCLAANGQVPRIPQWGASQFIDTFFAYILGRAAIRNRRDFYFFTYVFAFILLFLLPFAVIESTTGRVILIPLYDLLPIVEPYDIVVGHHEPRMGLLRAQTGAAHPILYGVLCAMGFSFVLLGLSGAPSKPSFVKRLSLSLGSLLGTFFSLSAGAFAALGIQILLMLYNWLLRKWAIRWYALGTMFAALYILIAMVSIRPPPLVLARLISFSPSTAWNRYQIWLYGSDEVMRNPVFGMGIFVEWQRAAWMPQSIDNEWLLSAMRFGLIGVALILSAFAIVLFRLTRMSFSSNPEMSAIRNAFAFTLVSLLVAYATVAAWNIQWSLLLLLLGGSTWIYSDKLQSHTSTSSDQAELRGNHHVNRKSSPPLTRQIMHPQFSRETAELQHARGTAEMKFNSARTELASSNRKTKNGHSQTKKTRTDPPDYSRFAPRNRKPPPD